jgi:anaerobic selenocysteine-containing dehydrogenase
VSHCGVSLNPDDAEKLGVGPGDIVDVATRRARIRLPAEIDARMAPGHVSIPNGF